MIKKIFSIVFIFAFFFSNYLFAWDSCLPSDNESKLKCEKEIYVETNIPAIAHEYWIDAVLWWTFYVTNIQWIDENKATVEFEDGHILFITEINFDTWNKITELFVTYPEDFYNTVPVEIIEEKEQVGILQNFFNRIVNFFKGILK